MTRIVDLVPGMKGLFINFVIIEIDSPTITKVGREVRSVKVSDETGSVNMSIWDNLGKAIFPGDVFRMEEGYASIWKLRLTLYLGRKGVLCPLPYETSPMRYSITPNMSKLNPAYEGLEYRGPRRYRSRRYYNVVAVYPANSVGPRLSALRSPNQGDPPEFVRPGRSADPPFGPLPPPPQENWRRQLTISYVNRPNANAAASAVVAPNGRPATYQARPAAAAPAVPVMHVAPRMREPEHPPPQPLLDFYQHPRHGRGH